MNNRPTSRDEHFNSPGPKRILSLDGGGVRGVLTLGVLKSIEDLLRERHDAGPDFRLCQYFDLIAGTSTGAIIAAALALGKSVEEVQVLYRDLAKRVFQKSLFRQGFVRAKYSPGALTAILKNIFGEDTTLASDRLKTGLLVVMKRSDTGSPWPISNNPKGKYYDPGRPLTIPNKDYPLWAVVRASAAAPSYFDPEYIIIAKDEAAATSVKGTFVDGGVSVANNPSLLALRFASLRGYGLSWPLGPDQVLLISVGTGTRNPSVVPSQIAGYAAVQSLLGLMDDCNSEVETMMQWLGRTHTGRVIDREIKRLEGDDLMGSKLFTYERYNVELSEEGLMRGLELELTASELDAVQEMDAPENVELLDRIGACLGRSVAGEHFPQRFDLERQGGAQ
jgi:predicted acylesterase/phospholipase RssA